MQILFDVVRKIKKDFQGSFFIFLPLLLILTVNQPSLAQDIPDDDVTASMKQYLHVLNGGEVSPEKLTRQLLFMQKVRGIWENPRFNELRQKPLREIIEHNIGHDLFISAVAFHEENSCLFLEDDSEQDILEHMKEYNIPEVARERVVQILSRAIQFRKELKRYGDSYSLLHGIEYGEGMKLRWDASREPDLNLIYIANSKANPKALTEFFATFVLIPSGTFLMGSPLDEKGRFEDERQHEVTLTRDFYMMTTEVTQRMWFEVTGENPSYFKGEKYCKDSWNGKICPDHPVESINWVQAISFANKVSERNGLKPCYGMNGEINAPTIYDCEGYRLPTEAEWEYAARAGTQTAYSFGNNEESLKDYAWFGSQSTHPVGTKIKNPWGLYDMHGNAWEWTNDWYGFYSMSNLMDPQGPPSGSDRVTRGGGWIGVAPYLRSASRYYGGPDLRDSDVGFRLVRTKK